MYKTTQSSKHVKQEKKRAAFLALIIGLVLFLAKVYAYKISHSKAILSDALESIINIASAIMTVFVISFISRPINKKFPYGPGKIESFASGFEGGAISIAGLMIVLEGISALITQNQITKISESIIIIIVTGVINGLAGMRLLIIGKKTNSVSLRSAGIHLISDFWTSFGVIIGLGITKLTGKYWADPLVAIIIGIHLGWNGLKILKQSFLDLLDSHDIDLIKKIGTIFDNITFMGIIRIHYTRVIRSGEHHHIDAHAIVPDFWSTKEAFLKTKKFETLFLQKYRHSGELHLHLDPCLQKFCIICEYPDCPIRKKKYQGSKPPYSIDELINPSPFKFE